MSAAAGRSIEGYLTLDINGFTKPLGVARGELASFGNDVNGFNNGLSNSFKKTATDVDVSSKKINTSMGELSTSVGNAFRTGLGDADKFSKSVENIGKSTSTYIPKAAKDLYNFSSQSSYGFRILSSEMDKYTQEANKVSNSSTPVSTGIDRVGRSTRGMNAELKKAKSELKLFSHAFGIFGAAAGVFSGLVGFTLAQSIYNVTNASINAYSNIEKMSAGMGWSVLQVKKYTDQMNELQKVYRKIDMRFVASETATIARMYGLTADQATAAIEPMAILNDAFVREGRTATDASLAIKDLIDQGPGWERRLGEVGVNRKNLTDAGWSGDKSDKMGLINALAKVEQQRSLDKMAKEVKTLDDVWAVLSITIGQFLADILIPLTPYIVSLVMGFSSLVNAARGVPAILMGVWASIPDAGKLVLISLGIMGIVAAIGILGLIIYTAVLPAVAAYTLAMMNALIIGPLFSASAISITGGLGMMASGFLALEVAGAPIWAIGLAIIALIVVVYELGVAWGWWTDLSSFGAAIMARLTDAWNTLVWAGQQLWGVLQNLGSTLGNIWNIIVGAFYDKEGNWLGIFGGLQNIGGIVWNYLSSVDWIGLFAQLGSLLTSAGQGIWTYLFGGGAGGGSGVTGAITNWFNNIDWIGVLTQALSVIATYNPITLIVRLLFGDQAANDLSQGIINVFTTAGTLLGDIWTFIFGNNNTPNLADRVGTWLGDLGGAIINYITTIDYVGIAWSFVNGLIWAFAHYNPVTLIAVLFFGPEAGLMVQNAAIALIWGLINTFMVGLNILYQTVSWIVTQIYGFFAWAWNAIYWGAVNTWNWIYGNAVVVWNAIHGFFAWVGGAIYATVSWVWNNIVLQIWGALTRAYNYVHSVFTQVYNTILRLMQQVYNTAIKPITDSITWAFNGMRDGLTGAANYIRDHVWGPINTLWGHLREFWNWITGGNGGGPGGEGGAPAGGPDVSRLGYSGRISGSGRYAGFFNAIAGAAFDTTEHLTGSRPAGGYAGGPAGGYYAGDDEWYNVPPDGYQCLDDSCYAGDWDFSKYWKDQLLKMIYGWDMTRDGLDLNILDVGKGNMTSFAKMASALISRTHYEFYYGDKYSNAEALRRGGFNCLDGAQILVGLAQGMGLPAYIGHGYWGTTNTRHAWAVVNGVPFDSTAFQQRRTWSPPPGSMRAGGSNISSGNGEIIEKHYHYHYHINGDVYGYDDFKSKVRTEAREEIKDYNEENTTFYE